MKYKAILFDLDDTLLDFGASENVALDHVYDRYFSHVQNRDSFKEQYQKINIPLWEQVEVGRLRPDDVKVERFVQLLKAYQMEYHADPIAHFYLESLGNSAVWIPGAEETLNHLKGKFTIGIVTNGLIHSQQKKYHLCGLSQWCTCFLISEQVGLAKPDRKIFEIALQHVDAEPHETLMVGDSLAFDYQGAINTGLDFCWINPSEKPLPPSFSSPKYTVRSVADLSDIIIPDLICPRR